MTPAARLAAVIDVLSQTAETGRPADQVVTAYCRSRRYIGAKDRRAVTDRVFAILRHHARLGWWLDRVAWPGIGPDRAPGDGVRGRIAAQLRLVDGLDAAAVAALFDGSVHGPAPLSTDERAALSRLPDRLDADPAMPPLVRLECPDWAGADLGDQPDLLASLLDEAPVDLRVNPMVADRADVIAALAADGLNPIPTPFAPQGVRLGHRAPLTGHPLYRSGAIEVQDEASQLVTVLTDAQPGHQVADFCAGAGGKSLALAAGMAGRGRVVACDVSEPRLAAARDRIRRAGAHNIEPRLLSSERDRWIARQKGKFDRVLVDAPCSGSGAWRRSPDSRWRPVDLAALTDLQDRLLLSAGRLVKPGGRLVYATCSLLAAENQRRIDTFLSKDIGFRALSAGDLVQKILGKDLHYIGDGVILSPVHTFTDGFYIAVLERK